MEITKKIISKSVITLTTKKGSNLTREEADIIDKYRKKEFNSKPLRKNKEFEKHLFFLLKEDSIIISFGRLKEISVLLGNKKYNIFGIATIISIKKGRGYGKKLMKNIKRYVLKSKKTGIGFCNPKLSIFYQKCGYKTIASGGRQFIHKEKNKIIPNNRLDDVLYIDGKDKLGSKIALDENLKIFIPCKLW